jgi:hypothetical protein
MSRTILVKHVMWSPQFVFGIILVSAWLIFLVIPFLIWELTIDQYLIAIERISAIFAVALGFVWGHYFGQKSSEESVKMLKDYVNQLQDRLLGQSRA